MKFIRRHWLHLIVLIAIGGGAFAGGVHYATPIEQEDMIQVPAPALLMLFAALSATQEELAATQQALDALKGKTGCV